MKIKTCNDWPPIPTREMDWSAYEEDHDERRGHGATEIAAIRDLLDQLEDQICELCGDTFCKVNHLPASEKIL